MEMMNGGFKVSDELLGTFAPIILYWAYSGIYVLLGSLEGYRLHSKKDEDEKNLVPKKDVVKGVLLQQAVQAVVATILFAVTGSDSESAQAQQTSLIVLARQFLVAMMVLDTWQYFMHRYMHHNKFLYRHIHSQHHRLVVPYALELCTTTPLKVCFLIQLGGL
ncbi:UNVERIFIED_CONTAM: Sphinganine C4-monooxygenase 1 [Sesamum latifolium]|uniref:Sphinganine C4-monooxygenase 1 n=1 Tax=Sesamum latifolium TaxID=2727402 RepID=A0AAW2WZ17_9LAMI